MDCGHAAAQGLHKAGGDHQVRACVRACGVVCVHACGRAGGRAGLAAAAWRVQPPPAAAALWHACSAHCIRVSVIAAHKPACLLRATARTPTSWRQARLRTNYNSNPHTLFLLRAAARTLTSWRKAHICACTKYDSSLQTSALSPACRVPRATARTLTSWRQARLRPATSRQAPMTRCPPRRWRASGARWPTRSASRCRPQT